MQKNKKKILWKVVNVGLTLLTFVFAYRYGVGLVRGANLSGQSINYWLVLLAALCFIAFYIILAIHWLYVCRVVDPKTPSRQSLAFFASQPYKYLPSSIFTFSFRAKFAKDLGMPIKQSSFAQVIENVDILVSGAVVSFIFYLFSLSVIKGGAALLVITLMLGAIYITKLNVKLPGTKNTIPVHSVIPCYILATAGWILSGFALVSLNHAFGLSGSISVLIAANAASYVISILAFFAPGGIGVRELVMSAFAVQNITIVAWRILTSTADMVLGVLGIFAVSRKKL